MTRWHFQILGSSVVKILCEKMDGEIVPKMEEKKTEKRKINVLTIAQRINIIDEFEAGGSKVSDIARRFRVPQSTVSTILKNREKWRQKKLQNGNLQGKRAKAPVDGRLERAVIIFVSQARQSNIPLSGQIIRQKACQLAEKLGVTDFKGSSGWLFKFLKRHKISFKKLCGESAAVDTSMAKNWMTNVLPEIIREYEAKDIYNADETGLFYKCLPDKTYAFQSETCHGGKYSKQRLTVLCAANMDGTDKLPLLVIGKSRRPRCFKNVKSLPVEYEANAKAWMTSVLFEKWILEVDRRMTAENRSILMFVDNCTAHPKAIQDKLHSIKLAFFPPNATSVLQPLDLGIIKSLKH
ncbi:tigger transposable element-derived protein 4-like [Aedes albopictus]|uniref:HTH CENPB-type domain-containing protein n=1 Tax=Aedes albopictus TaxID=7160 RepID=A0ABM1Y982_AEDAL